jgi:DNA-binding NarL/FixJ family response regulator
MEQNSVQPNSDPRIRLGELAHESASARGIFAGETAVLAAWCPPESDLPSDRWRDQLRSLAVSCDAVYGRSFQLSQLWFELCSGRMRLRETFATEQRYYAVIERIPAGHRTAIRARSLDILTRVLLGENQKVIAVDLSLARSTITANMQVGLRIMGVRGKAHRAPMLLTIAAFSAHRSGGATGRRSQLATSEPGEPLSIVSVRRPDLDFPVPLSNAERIVLQALAAGFSHAEISTLRATSPRTIANQIAAAFRKLGVSGRGELLKQLVTHCLQAQSKEHDERIGLLDARIHGEASAGAA